MGQLPRSTSFLKPRHGCAEKTTCNNYFPSGNHGIPKGYNYALHHAKQFLIRRLRKQDKNLVPLVLTEKKNHEDFYLVKFKNKIYHYTIYMIILNINKILPLRSNMFGVIFALMF